jgi:chromosome partitioning protein
VTRSYALVNQKGGVGKTTTAINLGAFLALAGQRVLIVDDDPQANATSSLGVDLSTVTAGLYEALIRGRPTSECLLHNARLKLWLLPSSPALAGAQIELVDMPHRESQLRQMLAAVQDRFDYILIDCPPSLGLLTVNGFLAASSGVIIPVQCEYLALEGLSQLMATIQRVRTGLFPGLAVRGLLLTMFDARTNLSREVEADIREHFTDQVFQAVIPRSVRLAEAPSHGLPISAYDPSSTGGKAYLALADEVLRQDGVRQPALTAAMEG